MPVNSHQPIAVIVPCFNEAATLGRALESCLAQPDVARIIVVDDCSQDASPAVARFYALKDRRVELIQLPNNKGPAYARNVGAEHAKQPILAFLDADDEYLPGALRDALKYLELCPERPAVRLDVEFYGFPEHLLAFPNFDHHASLMSDIVSSSLVVRRPIFMTLGGFSLDETFRRYGGEDCALSNALTDIYGYTRIVDRKRVRMHYHERSHVARYFSRVASGGSPEQELIETREALDRFVENARIAVSKASEGARG